MTAMVDIVVSHLVMRSAAELRATAVAPEGIRIRRATQAHRAMQAAECYVRVGAPWAWTDRAHWTHDEWESMFVREHGELWIARSAQAFVGFYLLTRVEADVVLQYFGLVPEWIGKGIGGWLLERAIERAWALDGQRVTLETCTLDGPAALGNYLSRGFVLVREEHRSREVDHGSG